MSHIAAPRRDVAGAAAWYRKRLGCRIAYLDATRALPAFANSRPALVLPGRYPPHIGFERRCAARFCRLTLLRDGTRPDRIAESEDNAVEILKLDGPALRPGVRCRRPVA